MLAVSMQRISPIRISLNLDEARRARAQKIKAAIIGNDHFLLDDPTDCPFDLRFQWEGRTINVELKDFTGDSKSQSDYVSSIVNRNSHLYRQVLAGRELLDPLIIVVLGDDTDIVKAIADIVNNRCIRGQIAEERIIEYACMVEQFEANCIGVNIHVWRLKVNPWRRMLLNVRKILQGGDLIAFRPRPASGERQAVGLSILCGKGLGPGRANRILERFDISLVPKRPDTYLDDCPGIGPKLVEVVRNSLFVHPDHVNRR